MNWLLRQFKQPSTWKGLFVLAGLLGYSLDPELQTQIVTAVIAVFGIIEIVRNEHKVDLPPIELQGQPMAVESVPVPTAVGVLRQPVQSRHNTDEAADMDYQRPGWNG